MTLSQDEQRKLEAIEEALPHRPKADPLLRRNEQRGLGDSSPQVPDPPRRTAALTNRNGIRQPPGSGSPYREDPSPGR